jgi:hypothetical protein
MEGFVYVMSNELMPGVVKVGYTTRTPDARALEMSSHEAVPVRMRVEYYAFVDAAVSDVESRAHRHLRDCNVAKEWFRCDVPKAILAVRKACDGGLRHEKVHYVEPAELWRLEEQERRAKQALDAQDHAERQKAEAKRLARQAVVARLESDFLRLEPIAREIYNHGIMLRATAEIVNHGLNPVQWFKDAFEIQPKVDPEKQRISALALADLLQLIQYYQCGRLLREYSQRPTKPRLLDRFWNGDYFEVPPVVIAEFKSRQESASDKRIFNEALYVEEWNVLRDQRIDA